jgi:hypothetical protein
LVYKTCALSDVGAKFCLLTTASFLCDIEAESDGSGAGGLAARQ